jgi:hypothetical protein
VGLLSTADEGPPEQHLSGHVRAVLQMVLKLYASPHGMPHAEVAVVYGLGMLRPEHCHHRRNSRLSIERNCCMVFLDCTEFCVFDTKYMNYVARVSSEQHER